MNELRLLNGKAVITMYQLGESLVKWPKAAAVSDACCCDGEPPPPPCEPCVDFVEEITATLTVYDGSAPFGGICGGVDGEYEIVLTLGANGDGWWGYVDLDDDNEFGGLDWEVRITIEDCSMIIYTNIGDGLLNPAVWPPGYNGAGGYGFGECGTAPDGALDPAGSPYCRPPAGTYDYYYYLLEPAYEGGPPCDAKFCAWTLVIS